MTICLIGKNLTSLVLSKIFVNKGINVDLYYSNNKTNKMKSTLSRTIGLSNDSVNFLESYKILNKKDCWNIKQIKLFKENEPHSFLNFKSDKNSFSIISYNVLNESLETKLKKNKRIKIKKITYKGFYTKLLKKNYEIIIITDTNNFLFKKYFAKQFKKNYNSTAFTTIINHSKIQNNIAEQYFTRFGPLAFLPISNNQTSVVFSIFDKDLIKDKLKIKNLIEQYNRHYKIKNISTLQEFPINLFLSRNYFYKNILSFGDALHKVHPLAGQGFNMTVRDTKILSDLIDKNLELGLNLDTILEKFEIERKNPNFLFAMGIDFLHEFFKVTNKYKLKNVDYLFKYLNKNTFFKKKIEKFADKGFIF